VLPPTHVCQFAFVVGSFLVDVGLHRSPHEPAPVSFNPLIHTLAHLLSSLKQAELLSARGTEVVAGCMAMMAEGESHGLPFDVLRRLPQLCADAVLLVPRFPKQASFDHLAELVGTMLADTTSPEVARLSCDAVWGLLRDGAVDSGHHKGVFVNAAMAALLRGSSRMRSLCVGDLSVLGALANSDTSPIVSALLATCVDGPEFWLMLRAVIPAADLTPERLSVPGNRTFAVLEGMVLARPASAVFLFDASPQDGGGGGGGASVIDAAFEALLRLFGRSGVGQALDGTTDKQHSRMVASSQLLPFVRFMCVACVSRRGQDWFRTVFCEKGGLRLLLETCEREAPTSFGLAPESCTAFTLSLVDMACSANRQVCHGWR
jgi:hypothetical protein